MRSQSYPSDTEDAGGRQHQVDSVVTDVMGLSGRKMIQALIAGEKDPAKLARLADPRVKASQETLRQALRGRVTKSHRFLLRLHLGQIDALDAAIAELDREVETSIEPFAPPSSK